MFHRHLDYNMYLPNLYFHYMYALLHLHNMLLFDWAEKGIKLSQNTTFPVDKSSTITVDCKKAKRATIALRHPWWSKKMNVTVNGEQVTAEQEDGYILIERKWKKSDEIVITLQPELRYEVVPGGKYYHAYFYGPILLGTRVSDPNIFTPSISIHCLVTAVPYIRILRILLSFSTSER